MIDIAHLQFSYPNGQFVLAIERLNIAQGEAVAVIGPSGSGKTTLLNLIAGVIKPERGRICIKNTELSQLTDQQRRHYRLRNIGLVFQEFELLEYLNVRDNILLTYRLSPSLELSKAVCQRAETLAQITGIADKLKRQIKHLSQGERQRVAFCRALLPDPPLLLADEPTGNLDPTNTKRILDILFEHVRKTGTTLITVTHDRSDLGRFDRVVDFSDFAKATSDV